MQPIRFVAISLASVAAISALACSDQFPIGPPGARRSPASNLRSSAAIIAPNTRICSNPTTTTVLYNGNWVPAFLTDLDAVHANFPNAYATTIDGSVWISPTPTSGNSAPGGTYNFKTTFDLPADGAFGDAAINGVVHADNAVTIRLNGNVIFQHAAPIDMANLTDPPEGFSAIAGFASGPNTLAFDVFNEFVTTPNPAGLNFCLTVDYADPAPPQAAQDIVFTSVAPNPAIVGDTYLVTASASSGLPVTFGSLTRAVCTLLGATLHFVGEGVCSVVADQDGDANFFAAARQMQSFPVITALPTWAFGGFLQPVDNLPTVNLAKAGSAIPVKFSLGADYGLNIFVAGSPSTLMLACGSSLQTNVIEETVSVTSNGLTYDATTGIYQFVWKSEKSWTGSCRQLSLKFADGSEYRATFQFR